MIKFPAMGPRLTDGPPGSDAWNAAVCSSLQIAVNAKDRFNRKAIADQMERVVEHDVWNKFPPEKPIGIKKFSEEITGKPWSWIINELREYGDKPILEKVESAVRLHVASIASAVPKAPPSDQKEKPRNPNGRKGKESSYKNNHVTRLNDRGNASTYRIGKLKRDHPDVARRLEAGEFKTVAEAERAAGIGRPKMTQVDKVARAYDKLSPPEREEFFSRISDL